MSLGAAISSLRDDNILVLSSGRSSTSIALDANGYPHISYLDTTNGALKYAYWMPSFRVSELRRKKNRGKKDVTRILHPNASALL